MALQESIGHGNVEVFEVVDAGIAGAPNVL